MDKGAKMCEGKTTAAYARDLFPSMDEVRPCGNPQCRRLFRPRSKYHPNQIYCGCDECNRSRHRQRQWKYRHPDLHGRRGGEAAAGPRGCMAAVSLRLLWLFIGLLAVRRDTGAAGGLARLLERTVEAGRRACGGRDTVLVLQSILTTVT